MGIILHGRAGCVSVGDLKAILRINPPPPLPHVAAVCTDDPSLMRWQQTTAAVAIERLCNVWRCRRTMYHCVLSAKATNWKAFVLSIIIISSGAC